MKKDKIYFFLDYLIDNPILTGICIVFVIANIVLLTCIIYDRIHQKEVNALNNTCVELIENRDELSGLLEGMRRDYEQVSEKLNRMDAKFKELERQTRDAQAGLNSKISSLTADLHTCQNVNVNFISEIKEKETSILSLSSRLSDYEKVTVGLKKIFSEKLVLEPTWIKGGEPYTVSNVDFVIVIDEPAENSQCLEGSTAAVRLVAGDDKKTLCVGIDRPERFRHKKKNYSVDLLAVGDAERNHEYLVSIVQ
jgi:predicted RNase H-like nuclease (RuvC/YqgF family)